MQVTLYLRKDTMEKLDRHCKYSKMSKSGLVDDVINKYLDEIDNLFADHNYSYDSKLFLIQSLNEINNRQLDILDILKRMDKTDEDVAS